jgi:transcriptional regulator with XRE-family HTH domain
MQQRRFHLMIIMNFVSWPALAILKAEGLLQIHKPNRNHMIICYQRLKSIAQARFVSYLYRSKLPLRVRTLELNQTLPTMKAHNAIKAIRFKKGYSQEYMAICLGMSQKNFSKIERGETRLTVLCLEKIAEIFAMQVTEVLQYDHEPASPNDTFEKLEERVANVEHEVASIMQLFKRLLSGGGNSQNALAPRQNRKGPHTAGLPEVFAFLDIRLLTHH